MTPTEVITWISIIFFAIILFGTLGVVIGAVIYTVLDERKKEQANKKVGKQNK